MAAVAGSGIVTTLCAWEGGLRARLEDAQAQQERAEQALRLCKPWLPRHAYRVYQHAFAQNQSNLHVAAAAAPGETLMLRMAGSLHTAPRVACTGCGRLSIQLRKCSARQVAAYCSRECQAKHWKEGGHRRECAQLAAQRAAAGGGGGS